MPVALNPSLGLYAPFYLVIMTVVLNMTPTEDVKEAIFSLLHKACQLDPIAVAYFSLEPGTHTAKMLSIRQQPQAFNKCCPTCSGIHACGPAPALNYTAYKFIHCILTLPAEST
jgi:hypothetical protein